MYNMKTKCRLMISTWLEDPGADEAASCNAARLYIAHVSFYLQN